MGMRPALLQAVCLAATLTWTACTSGPGQAAQSPRPEQRQNLAAARRERDVVEDINGPVPHREAADGNDGLAQRRGVGDGRTHLVHGLSSLGVEGSTP